MLPEPRRAVAYIAARLIGKRNGSAIYDYTGGGGYTHFSGSVGGNISIFDHSATVEPAQWLIPFMHESGDICAVQPGRRRAVRMKGSSSVRRPYFKGGRNSPLRSFATMGDRKGSSPSQRGH